MLFNVQALDPQAYIAVMVLVGAVTLLAACIPARRAAAINPSDVLKTG